MYKPVQLPDGLSAPGKDPYMSETEEHKLMMHQMHTEQCGHITNHSAIFRKRSSRVRAHRRATCQPTMRTVYVYARVSWGHTNEKPSQT